MEQKTKRLLLDRYDVLEAQGGTELYLLYRARDTQTDDMVWVKVLRGSLADRTEVIEAWQSGVQKMQSLPLLGVARLLATGKEPGVGDYCIEESMPGESPLNKDKTFSEGVAVKLVQQLAETLETAHARGVVHGDVRPSNIRVLPDGSPLLVNAGSAPALRAVARANPRLLRDATPYMAPDSGATPERGDDIYSLGAVFYELLTGQLPDPANPSPRRVNANLSVILDTVVRKAMAYASSDRYDTMAALLKDLKRYTPPEAPRPVVKERITARKPLPAPSPEMVMPSPEMVMPSPEMVMLAPSLDSPSLPIIEPIPAIIEPIATITPIAPVATPVPIPPLPTPVAVPDPSPVLETNTRMEPKETPETLTKPSTKQMPVSREAEVATARPKPHRSTAWLTFLNLLLMFGLVGLVWGLIQTVQPLFHPVREVVVPNLVDKTKAEAEKLARENGFVLSVVDSVYNEKIAKDVILHQDPPPARIIREGKSIRIDLSRGPRMVEVPDVTGMAMERARRILEKNGLKLGKYSGEFDVVVAKGDILRQKPEAGEQLKRGGEIELVISKGEEMPIEQATPEPELKPVDTPLVDDNRERSFKVEYTVPTGEADEHVIRIDINDARGQGRTVYEKSLKPGTKLTQEVIGQGLTVDIFVYDNDEMKQQLTL
jgi:eukaryotic-like serine/threonine-protein kinase